MSIEEQQLNEMVNAIQQVVNIEGVKARKDVINIITKGVENNIKAMPTIVATNCFIFSIFPPLIWNRFIAKYSKTFHQFKTGPWQYR